MIGERSNAPIPDQLPPVRCPVPPFIEKPSKAPWIKRRLRSKDPSRKRQRAMSILVGGVWYSVTCGLYGSSDSEVDVCDAGGGRGTGCVFVWKAVAHRHVSGGVAHQASTITNCQAACVNDSSCVGVDFNNAHQCFLIQAGAPGQGTALIIGEDEDAKQQEEKGCVHYDLKRTCNAGELVRRA